MNIVFQFFGLNSCEVNGNLDQKQRLEAIEKFQNGGVDFLLATDLIARGIDIQHVDSIINFEFPKEAKRYVHRIGRTARAGTKGAAITICNDEERTLIKKISRKEGYNINTFSVTKTVINSFEEKLVKLEEFVLKVMQQEKEEKQIDYAMRDAEKAQNLITYAEEIKGRPKKTWFKSEKNKNELKKKELDNLGKIAAREKNDSKDKFPKKGGLTKERMQEQRLQKISKKNSKKKKTFQKDKKQEDKGKPKKGFFTEDREDKKPILGKRKAGNK